METESPSSPPSGHAFPRDVAGFLRLEQTRQAYDALLASQMITILNALVFVAVQSLVIAPPVLVGWFLAVCVVALTRLAVLWAFWRTAPPPAELTRWRVYFIVGAACGGTVWGAAAVVLFPPVDPAHQVFVAFMLGGMVAGSVATLAPVFPAFIAFAVPALAPAVVRFALEEDIVHYAMAWMIVVFLATVIVMARRSHRSLTEMLCLRIENAGLNGKLIELQAQFRRCQEELEVPRRAGR